MRMKVILARSELTLVFVSAVDVELALVGFSLD
jgi:hypothetical protein